MSGLARILPGLTLMIFLCAATSRATAPPCDGDGVDVLESVAECAATDVLLLQEQHVLLHQGSLKAPEKSLAATDAIDASAPAAKAPKAREASLAAPNTSGASAPAAKAPKAREASLAATNVSYAAVSSAKAPQAPSRRLATGGAPLLASFVDALSDAESSAAGPAAAPAAAASGSVSATLMILCIFLVTMLVVCACMFEIHGKGEEGTPLFWPREELVSPPKPATRGILLDFAQAKSQSRNNTPGQQNRASLVAGGQASAALPPLSSPSQQQKTLLGGAPAPLSQAALRSAQQLGSAAPEMYAAGIPVGRTYSSSPLLGDRKTTGAEVGRTQSNMFANPMQNYPPPICPTLVMPNTETRFLIPLEDMKRFQSGIQSGELEIKGNSGRALLTVSLGPSAMGGRALSIASVGCAADPRTTLIVDRPGVPHQLLGKDGENYGTLELRLPPLKSVLTYRDAVVMHLEIANASNMSVITYTTDGMTLATSGLKMAPYPEDCQGCSRCKPGDPRFADQSGSGLMWRMQAKPSVDAVLLATCMLAMLIFGGPAKM